MRAPLATLSAALLLAACGGSGSHGRGTGTSAVTGTPGGQSQIARAAYVSSQSSGYRFALRVSQTSSALGGPVSGTGDGTYNLPSHAGALNLQLTLPGVLGAAGPLSLREVISGQQIFIGLPALVADQLPGHRPWVELNLGKVGGMAGLSVVQSLTGGGGEANPGQFLAYLRAVSPSGAENLGHATVNGVDTTHYRGLIDLARAPAAVPAADRTEARQSIAAIRKLTGVTKLPVDVYVDAHNFVRRLELRYRAKAHGQSAITDLRMDFLAYGPQPVPATPARSQVSDLSSLLGSLSQIGGGF